MVYAPNNDELPDCSREPVSKTPSSSPRLARKSRTRLREMQPPPEGQDFYRVLVALRDDEAMQGLSLAYQHIVTQAFFRYGSGDGSAWFRYRQLASDLGPKAEPWTVKRAMHAARDAGILTIEEQEWADSRAQTNNKFQLASRFCTTPPYRVVGDPPDRIVLADALTSETQTTNQLNSVRSLQENSPEPKPISNGGFEFDSEPGHSTQSQGSKELELQDDNTPRTELSGGGEWHAEQEHRRKREEFLAALPIAEREERERKQADLDRKVQELIDREREETGDDEGYLS